jgi:hypothetical protein
MGIDVGKENKLIRLIRNIGGSGKIIKNMVLGNLGLKMEILMKGIFREG